MLLYLWYLEASRKFRCKGGADDALSLRWWNQFMMHLQCSNSHKPSCSFNAGVKVIHQPNWFIRPFLFSNIGEDFCSTRWYLCSSIEIKMLYIWQGRRNSSTKYRQNSTNFAWKSVSLQLNGSNCYESFRKSWATTAVEGESNCNTYYGK